MLPLLGGNPLGIVPFESLHSAVLSVLDMGTAMVTNALGAWFS